MHAGIPLILSQIILSIEAPHGNVKVFSGRGEIPHRWYMDNIHEPTSGPHSGVSRSGERPEPTVTVRMKESGR